MNTSKRILLITHLPILPATAGNKIRVWALMNNLRALGHEVWFMGLGLKPHEEQAIRKAWGDNVHIVPHVKARDAKPRLSGLKRWALDRAVGQGWISPDLDYRIWPHWDAALRKLAKEEKFDVVIVEYVFYSKALLYFEGAVKVIDTHDVFTDRAKKLRARNIKSYYWNLTRENEGRALARADVILAIQKHEAAFFEELTGGRKRVMVAGHTVSLRPLPQAVGEGLNLLFVGTSYAANVDGAKHFISKVLPLVRRQFPAVTLLIAGNVCDALPAGTPGVELLGVVENLDGAYRRATIVVNPVLTGTGLKTKTVEALGYAKPLVTTTCGADGIEDAAGRAFLMADEPAEMASQIAGLLESPARAASLAERGFKFAGDWNAAQIETLRSIHLPVAPSQDASSAAEPAALAQPMRILARPATRNRAENPYNAALSNALEKIPGVTVAEFTNRRALFERWDIVHVHWPDAALHSSTALGAAFAAGLLIARVRWARRLGAKIVWTVHNLRSHHAAYPRIEGWLWRNFIPLVDSCIHLSHAGRDLAIESFPGLAGKSHSVCMHGHYRGCYRNECGRAKARFLLNLPAEEPVIAFIGQIKAYKNVSTLIRAFMEANHPSAHLVIAGRPGDAEIEKDLRAIANNHPRIHFHFGLIPDECMHIYLNACDLTVFPYRAILNSGSAILALSFNRPALVPARGAMAELRQIAGPDWVCTYEGNLTGSILSAALQWAAAPGRPSECDLAALSWHSIALDTIAAYDAALGRRTATAYPEGAPGGLARVKI